MEQKSSTDVFVQDTFGKDPSFKSISEIPKKNFDANMDLLESLLSSPAIDQFFKDRVSKETERIREELTTQLRAEIEENYKKELAEKIELGIQERTAELKQELSSVMGKFLQERENLLKSRSQGWLESMVKILKSFMVYRGTGDSECLRTWLDESLKLFPEQKRVQVYVSAEVFGKLKNTEGDHFQILLDERLQSSQTRFECSEGGAIFDSDEQLKRLEKLIQN